MGSVSGCGDVVVLKCVLFQFVVMFWFSNGFCFRLWWCCSSQMCSVSVCGDVVVLKWVLFQVVVLKCVLFQVVVLCVVLKSNLFQVVVVFGRRAGWPRGTSCRGWAPPPPAPPPHPTHPPTTPHHSTSLGLRNLLQAGHCPRRNSYCNTKHTQNASIK